MNNSKKLQLISKTDHSILCIDDDKSFLYQVKKTLDSYMVYTATSLRSAFSILEQNIVDTVLFDLDLNGKNSLDILPDFIKQYPLLDIVIITAYKNPNFIVKAIKLGARDYLCKPVSIIDLKACIEKSIVAKKNKEHVNALIGELGSANSFLKIIGKNERFQQVITSANKLKGHHDANILIQGESGTGKEVIARYIHQLEKNIKKRPFIIVNCAAIPENLVESELFGHEKGAFTGAIMKKIGKFMLADGGDIFLDEIGCLNGPIQSKLLRVLQEKEFCAVGSNHIQQSNFRVIAATNDNLEKMVEENKFRLDLYHRLCTIILHVPALRNRKDDIRILASYFLKKHSNTHGKKILTESAVKKLCAYSWPGNIRELKNVIHNAYILAENNKINSEDISLPSKKVHNIPNFYEVSNMPCCKEKVLPLKTFLLHAEQSYINSSIETFSGNKQRTAYKLNISPSTLYGKLRQWKSDLGDI